MRRTITLLLATVLATAPLACERSISGIATVRHVDTALVDLVLPTVAEASKAVEQPLEAPDNNDKPFHGGPDVLFDGARDDKDITPFECESTVSVFSNTTFARSSLVAAARVLYYTQNRGQGVFSADATSFRFASPDDARRMMSRLAEHWQQCSGKTVTEFGEHGPQAYVTVSNVVRTAALLSENTVTRSVFHAPLSVPMPAQRAISVVADVMVVAQVDMDPDSGPTAPVGDRAITLVNLMAHKMTARL
jgi:hypothetical protein